MQHMRHIDELLYSKDGVQLLRDTLESIREREMLCGTPFQSSIKYDGSMSIVFGTVDGEFFVSTKSFFNKEQVKYTDEQSIWQAGLVPNQVLQLVYAYRNLSKHIYEDDEIYQADIMFIEKPTCIDEVNTICPNIVPYTFGTTEFDFGIAVHSSVFWVQGQWVTTAVDFNELHPSTWYMQFPSTIIEHNPWEIKDIVCTSELMAEMNAICWGFDDTSTTHIVQEDYPLLVEYMMMLDNAIIRGTESIGKGNVYSAVLMNFVTKKFSTKMNTYKTQDAITRTAEELVQLLAVIQKEKVEIDNVYKTRTLLRKFKRDFIEYICKQHCVDTLSNEHEGVVVEFEDSVHTCVKVVNREVFSAKNFGKYAK